MSGNGIVSKAQYKTSMQVGPVVAPKELVNSHIKQVAAPAGRHPVYTPVDTRMPVTEQNPIIEIKLGNSMHQWIDFFRGAIYIKVSLTGSGGGGTYIRPSNLIANMIERFELIDGNTQVEDYQHYGEKYTLDYHLKKKKNASNTSGFAFYGEGSQADRNARHATSASFEYKLPITSDILSKVHAFPNFEPFAQGNDQLIMRWYIAKGSAWIETNYTTYSWTVTQWDIYRDHLDLDDSKRFQDALLSASTVPGSLKYSWLNDDVFYRNLETTSKQTISLEIKKSSLQAILVTVRKAADVNNPLINDKFETWYGPQHPSGSFPLLNYQWRLDTRSWPDRPIQTDGPYAIHAYQWLLAYKNQDNGVGNLEETFDITPTDFATNSFVMVFDARVWPQLKTEVFNNVSTLKSNNSIHLELEFSTPPPAGMQLVIHTIHDKNWYFGFAGGGKVVW